MTHRPFFVFFVALTLAALVTSSASAQPGPPQGRGPVQAPRMAAPPPQGPPAQEPPPQGPQLTDEQRTKLVALATEQRDRLHAARDQMQKLQEQMRAELWADKPDEAKVKQLRGDLAKAQQELFAARLDFQTKRAQVSPPSSASRFGTCGRSVRSGALAVSPARDRGSDQPRAGSVAACGDFEDPAPGVVPAWAGGNRASHGLCPRFLDTARGGVGGKTSRNLGLASRGSCSPWRIPIGRSWPRRRRAPERGSTSSSGATRCASSISRGR